METVGQQIEHCAAFFEPLLNDEQTAKLLGDMHPKTLQRMTRNRLIPTSPVTTPMRLPPASMRGPCSIWPSR